MMDAESRNNLSIILPIEGMSCASCVARIEKAIKKISGVKTVTVNLAMERADIEADASVTKEKLVQTIEKSGYHVPLITHVTLMIDGMGCAACVGRIERALKKIPGVTAVAVNLSTEQASISGTADPHTLIKAIAEAGYSARPVKDSVTDNEEMAKRKKVESQNLKRDFFIALALAFPVFLLDMGGHFIASFETNRTSWMIQFVLTTVIIAFPGRRFYKLGLPALARFTPDMNSLVAIGTLAAYIYSLIATFTPSLLPKGTVHVYYEAASVIIVLILLGRYLEARAKSHTSEAVKRLIGLQARTAHVRREGVFMEIPVQTVMTGDILEVRPGERIPVDGTVTEGQSTVDESMITGEAIPVKKSMDTILIGGTINQRGTLTFRATAVGENTMLAQIIRMVEQAQGAKLPIQTVVDKVTLWFVPVIFSIAVLTFFIWLWAAPSPSLNFALVNAVAVLIIACPCAMGLATPTAIMVGTGRAAELGILFRKGDALQLLKDTRIVAFDKTGTLTEGRPALTDFQTMKGFNRDAVLGLVAAAESKSEHPVSHAILQASETEALVLPQVDHFETITGRGIKAQIGSQTVQVGSDRYMRELGLDLAPFLAEAERLGQEGKTPFYAAIEGTLAAIMAVADTIKKTTPETITALHALGIKTAMITGDHHSTAEAIAHRLDMDKVVAEVLPAGKVAVINQLKADYGKTTFVGDGINDAPALATADVGLAIGTGTDIAIESADIVLMSGQLSGVTTAIALSRATINNIHQNLFWAFAYNIVLIPVAAGALYPLCGVLLSPVLAAGAMALSSIFVLGNSLRLRGFHPAGAQNQHDNINNSQKSS